MKASPQSPGSAWLKAGLSFSATALVLIYLSYALPRILPGDFVTTAYSGAQVVLTAEQEASLQTLYSQDTGFVSYLGKLITLDWGYSHAFLAPVSELFLGALSWTLLLLGAANLLAMFAGFILGVEAAWRRGTRTEKGLIAGATVLEGIPEICTGVILLVIFALNLQWFPAAGAETAYAQGDFFTRFIDILHHLTLPLSTLVLAYLPGNFLITRNSMIMVLKAPFMVTARAKGLPSRRIRYAHAARNALLPVVTRFGLRLAFMITGALVVERINSYPGLGTLLFNAIQSRDLPVIQAVVLFSSLLVLAVILGLEGVYRMIDPRIRHAR